MKRNDLTRGVRAGRSLRRRRRGFRWKGVGGVLGGREEKARVSDCGRAVAEEGVVRGRNRSCSVASRKEGGFIGFGGREGAVGVSGHGRGWE